MHAIATTFDADIRKHRATDVTLTVLKRDGSPLANQEVSVAQRRHQFLFGGSGFHAIGLANGELAGQKKAQAEDFHAKLLEIFNGVTLPFYWGRFEPVQGKPDTKRLLATAKWFADRGCVVKGHPLCWHTVSADWLLKLPTEKIVETQLARIRRDVADFAGVVDTWDVINEVVIMPVFDKYDNGVTRMAKALGRIGIIRETFRAARETNPRATLLLNDFDTSAEYERLIEGVLEAGIQIDVLGIQSHMHQGWWGVEKTLDVLERFGKYKLPIHFTETNIPSGHVMPSEIVDLNDYHVDEWPTTPDGETRQAEEAVMHYKLLLANPLVQAVTWWDFIDGGWLKAPVGLIRTNQSPKPAFEALKKLIKGEWWTKRPRLTTDAAGRVRFNGFFGEYDVTAGQVTAPFTVSPAQAAATVRL